MIIAPMLLFEHRTYPHFGLLGFCWKNYINIMHILQVTFLLLFCTSDMLTITHLWWQSIFCWMWCSELLVCVGIQFLWSFGKFSVSFTLPLLFGGSSLLTPHAQELSHSFCSMVAHTLVGQTWLVPEHVALSAVLELKDIDNYCSIRLSQGQFWVTLELFCSCGAKL